MVGAAGGGVAIVVVGVPVVVVVVGGTVEGGVLTGVVVVVVVGFGGAVVVVVVGLGGSVVVVVGFRRAGLVVVVVGTLVVGVVDVVVGCRDGDGPRPPGGAGCLFGWEWCGAVGVPVSLFVDCLPTGASDRNDRDELGDVSDTRSAVSEITGTPAPVARLGISGRVAPT